MAIVIRVAEAAGDGPLRGGNALVRTAAHSACYAMAPLFRLAGHKASGLCPVSRLFAGAKITVNAALEPAR